MLVTPGHEVLQCYYSMIQSFASYRNMNLSVVGLIFQQIMSYQIPFLLLAQGYYHKAIRDYQHLRVVVAMVSGNYLSSMILPQTKLDQ